MTILYQFLYTYYFLSIKRVYLNLSINKRRKGDNRKSRRGTRKHERWRARSSKCEIREKRTNSLFDVFDIAKREISKWP